MSQAQSDISPLTLLYLTFGEMPRLLAFLFLVTASAIVNANNAGNLEGIERPHILFIVADDLGYNDLGFMQNTVTAVNPKGLATSSKAAGLSKTPFIDKLSSESTVLGSYYVQPLCSPSRATIMTGRYPQHTGIGPDVIQEQQPYGLPARERLLPQFLADHYSCHAVGKVCTGKPSAPFEIDFRYAE